MPGRYRRVRGTGLLLAWIVAGGCATGSGSPPAQVISSPRPISVQLSTQDAADPAGNLPGAAAAVRLAEREPSSETAEPAAGPEPSSPDHTSPSESPPPPDEEFVDPFARPGEGDFGAVEEYDPWEPWNTRVFSFNRKVDEYVVKPVAKGYNFVVPSVVQRGLSQMFVNIRFVPRLLNNVLQGKVKGAGIEASRFLINSTIGIGGFFDPAGSYFRLRTPEEDFGQTLGYYGVKPGPYLLLPLWPSPLTIRDGVGYVVDLFLDPWNWFVLPFFRVEGAPVLVENESEAFYANLATRGLYLLNERSLSLETFQGVEEATLDLYSAVRNAYLQRRAKAIRE